MKKLTKIFGIVTVLALTLTVATPASALTADQSALLDLLVSLGIIDASQVATVTAASTTTTGTGSSDFCGPFTRDLTVGSTGADVMMVQKALNGAGFTVAVSGAGSVGNESSYFGSLTASALASYQSAKGIAPAVGYFGALSRASFAGNCSTATTTTTTTTTTSTTLNGGAGDITISAVSEYSGEEVGEGDDDVPVMAVDIEADDDSDVQIKSVKVEFYQGTGADSQDLDDYASEVSVWYMGDKVGEADADDFSESSDYWSKSISLDNVVIEAGDEEQLTFAVSALNNLDSGDIDTDDWSVDLLSVRFVDGDGVTTTETADAALTDGAGTFEKDFDFAAFGTANDADLEVSLEDDDINDANVLDVDASDDTEHDVLSFTLDASGDSDIWVDEIPVVITTTGETDEAVIVVNASLWVDGDKISGTEDVPTGGAVTFDDLDWWINAGDEHEVILQVKLQEVSGALDDGDTVQATVTVASIDAEDEVGDSVTATGAAAADAHVVYDEGIQVEFVGSSYVKTSSDTTGINETVEFTLEFDITAFGDDMWVEDTCVTSSTPTVTSIDVYLEGDADFGSTTCTDVDSTGDQGTNWEVKEGDTETFSVTILGDGGEAAGAGSPVTFKARLAGIGYNVATDGAGDTVYSTDLTNFKSAAVTVYDR